MGKKITELLTLASGDLAVNDAFVVVDTDEGETKQIAAQDIVDAIATDFVQGLWTSANDSDYLTAIGLDADLLTFSIPANTTISSFGKTIIDDANAAAAQATLALTDTFYTETEIDNMLSDGTIDHGNLSGLNDDDHPQYILHSLATAANDFLVASGAGTFVKKTLAETGAILEGDIDHDNLQGVTANEHIDHSGVTLTAGTGLTGGGDISSNRTFNVDVGIGDDKIVQIDDLDAADNDYAKFTLNGLEGRSYSEVLSDLSGQASGAFDWNNQQLNGIESLVFEDGGSTVDIIRDEDDMASDDAAALATQQSIKAYVDSSEASLIKIAQNTPSAVASSEFTSGLTYSRLMIIFENVIPVTDSVDFYVTVSDDGGSTWESSGYYGCGLVATDSGGSSVYGVSNASQWTIAGGYSSSDVGGAAGEHGVSGTFHLFGFNDASFKTHGITHLGHWWYGGYWGLDTGAVQFNTASALDGIKFAFSSGNIESGTITVYGVDDS